MEPLQAGGGIIWVESTESTNSELRRHIGELDNLSVIAAREQTAGRGQGDHSWFSSPATNLTFSILFRFGEGFPVTLGSSDAVLVTQITTLAIRDHLLSRGIGSRIKWPNDIWTGDRKICGIWPAGLPNPVSMRELSGKVYNLDEELRALAWRLRSRYEEAASPEGRRRLDEKFSLNVFKLPSKP